MALNTFKCNYLMPLRFKGLMPYMAFHGPTFLPKKLTTFRS